MGIGGITETLFISLSQLRACSHQYQCRTRFFVLYSQSAGAQIAGFRIVSGYNTDHRHPPGFQHQLVTDFSIVSSGSTGHRHQYRPWLQSSAQMSSWLQVAAQATDIGRLLLVTQVTAVAGPRTQTWPLALAGHKYHQVLRQEYRIGTRTSTRPPEGSSGLRRRHGSASFHHICISPFLHRPHRCTADSHGAMALKTASHYSAHSFCPPNSACKCSCHGSGSRPLLSEAP